MEKVRPTSTRGYGGRLQEGARLTSGAVARKDQISDLFLKTWRSAAVLPSSAAATFSGEKIILTHL